MKSATENEGLGTQFERHAGPQPPAIRYNTGSMPEAQSRHTNFRNKMINGVTESENE